MQVNEVTFPSGDGTAELKGLWHLPTRRATNGALIVLHGGSYTKESELNQWLCEAAAQIGLTALRFDFRYVQSGQAATRELTDEVDDLLGAFNFLQSFGKEIKPKRFYVVGKSLGAIVALKAVTNGPLAGAVKGVAALGLPLHDPIKKNWYDYAALQKLTCPILFVVGEQDQLGNPLELQPLFDSLSVPKELALIAGGGHSYEPVQLDLGQAEKETRQKSNWQRVTSVVTAWLERQDQIREDLRK